MVTCPELDDATGEGTTEGGETREESPENGRRSVQERRLHHWATFGRGAARREPQIHRHVSRS